MKSAGIRQRGLSKWRNALLEVETKRKHETRHFFIHIVSSWFYFKNINVMNLNIRQGTNEAWFIYNGNKVYLALTIKN